MLKKRDITILMVKKRSVCYLKKTHTFGIQLPKTVVEDYRIHKEKGNNLWTRAISNEITDTKVIFKLLKESENVPTGYTFVCYHMIFDVKMEDFCRESHLVAGGHITKTQATMTYDIVVSCDTVRWALVNAALNNLEVKCGDVMNA